MDRDRGNAGRGPAGQAGPRNLGRPHRAAGARLAEAGAAGHATGVRGAAGHWGRKRESKFQNVRFIHSLICNFLSCFGLP